MSARHHRPPPVGHGEQPRTATVGSGARHRVRPHGGSPGRLHPRLDRSSRSSIASSSSPSASRCWSSGATVSGQRGELGQSRAASGFSIFAASSGSSSRRSTSRSSGPRAARPRACGRSSLRSSATRTAARSAGGQAILRLLGFWVRPRLLPRLHLDLHRQAPPRLARPHRRDRRHQATLIDRTSWPSTAGWMWPSSAISCRGEVAERLMAALLKSAESKDFVGSNPTLSAIVPTRTAVAVRPDTWAGRPAGTGPSAASDSPFWPPHSAQSSQEVDAVLGRLIRRFGASAAVVMLALVLALSPAAAIAARPRLLGLEPAAADRHGRFVLDAVPDRARRRSSRGARQRHRPGGSALIAQCVSGPTRGWDAEPRVRTAASATAGLRASTAPTRSGTARSTADFTRPCRDGDGHDHRRAAPVTDPDAHTDPDADSDANADADPDTDTDADPPPLPIADADRCRRSRSRLPDPAAAARSRRRPCRRCRSPTPTPPPRRSPTPTSDPGRATADRRPATDRPDGRSVGRRRRTAPSRPRPDPSGSEQPGRDRRRLVRDGGGPPAAGRPEHRAGRAAGTEPRAPARSRSGRSAASASGIEWIVPTVAVHACPGSCCS